MRTRVKICGITRDQDARAAVQAGCDAIGFVFHSASPRNVDTKTAAGIAAVLPPFISTVALFMNTDAGGVDRTLTGFQPHALQFHGEESEDFCKQFGLPYIKAIAMGGNAGTPDFSAYPSAAALLLDGHVAGGMGGTGRSFDWSGLAVATERPIVLAGGLNVGNVAAAVAAARPYAVDVSSGVESAPGLKDAELMQQFVSAAGGAQR